MTTMVDLTEPATTADPEPLLVVNDLVKTFGNGVKAVDGVSFTINPGQTVGLVGESGCGKSTTAKMLLRTLSADSGLVKFDGEDLLTMRGKQLRALRSRFQVVPQNPQTSLNPRLPVRSSIEFNLRAQKVPKAERAKRIDEVLDQVGLPAAFGERFPHELSGGQLQRAAIARAISTRPELIICDEAVSALDKSIQAQILNLLTEFQTELGMAYLFISHDLSVVEHISDQVLVMYLGRIVEDGTGSQLWNRPGHPYTDALLSAAPGSGRERLVLQGDPPSPANPPSGCTFHTRCPIAIDACAEERPHLRVAPGGSLSACIRASAT